MPLLLLAFFVFLLWILQDKSTRKALWRNIKEAVREYQRETEICVPVREYQCDQLPLPQRERTPIETRIGGQRLSDGQWASWKAVEELTGHEFLINERPSFLPNPETGRFMELDCYNEFLKVAVEYNGIQHYRYTTHFHRRIEDFESQKRRDANKTILCNQLGIYLIIVPYTVRVIDIKEFIRQALLKRYYL